MSDVKAAFILHSLQAGGAERNALEVSDFLTKNNLCCDVILVKPVNDFTKEKNSNYAVKIISLFKNSEKISRLRFIPSCIFLLFKLMHIVYNNNYSVLLGGEEYFSYYLALSVSILLRKKCILIVGNNLLEELTTKNRAIRIFHRFLLFCSFRLCSQVIVVSYGIKKQLIHFYKLLPDQIQVIYNGINVKKIQSQAGFKKKLSSRKNKNQIAVFSRLDPKKNIEGVLRAVKLIKNYIPNVRLLIIGKGSEELRLKHIARRLKIDQDVFFVGYSENPFELLRQSRVLIFNSYYEGFGNVILEAMACGLPVISADCEFGPREILANRTYYSDCDKAQFAKHGVLVPADKLNDSDEIKRRKERILVNTTLSLLNSEKEMRNYSAAGLQRVNDFSDYVMAKKYGKVIQKVLDS